MDCFEESVATLLENVPDGCFGPGATVDAIENGGIEDAGNNCAGIAQFLNIIRVQLALLASQITRNSRGLCPSVTFVLRFVARDLGSESKHTPFRNESSNSATAFFPRNARAFALSEG